MKLTLFWFKKIALVLILVLVSPIFINSKAQATLPDFDTSGIIQVAPGDLKDFWAGPGGEGISFLNIFSAINNVILILAVLFSIIGSVIGVIKLVTGNFSENTNDAKEGKTIITNSVIAFSLAVSIYFILRLILNTIGASDIERLVNPTTPATSTTTP